MKKVIGLFIIVLVAGACNKSKIGYTVPVIDPTNTYDNRSLGVSANDFLSSKKYKVINLDIVYVQKHALPDSVIDATVSFLNQYCYKPSGINVSVKEIGRQGGDLGANNLSSIEKVWRTKFTTDGKDGIDSIGLFVFVGEGTYFEKEVLGLAYKNTSIAIFDGSISEISGGEDQPSRTDVLNTVIRHEIGHVFGLVNAGTEMQVNHQDEVNGKHCDNTNCLMHYTMQRKEVVNLLLSGAKPELDDNCKADLRANGSK